MLADEEIKGIVGKLRDKYPSRESLYLHSLSEAFKIFVDRTDLPVSTKEKLREAHAHTLQIANAAGSTMTRGGITASELAQLTDGYRKLLSAAKTNPDFKPDAATSETMAQSFSQLLDLSSLAKRNSRIPIPSRVTQAMNVVTSKYMDHLIGSAAPHYLASRNTIAKKVESAVRSELP